MQNYERFIDLNFVTKKSCFLLGPRQTGKSTLLKKLFPNAYYINLLKAEYFSRYISDTASLYQEVIAANLTYKLIIIDEIQKIPSLLNEVHLLIEEGYFFILTGSSARKLRKGGVNLLGGRARQKFLFPLTTKEIGDYDFLRLINFGSLPSIYLSDDPLEDLESYVATYLKEEIYAESLVRNLSAFSKFLDVAALSNSELVNFSSIASDVGVSSKTVQAYYEILNDTLIGTSLPPYEKTITRKAVTISKFYFFDVGVANFLVRRFQIETKSEMFGKAFEHLIFCELKAYLSYSNDKRPLSFWRTSNGDFEVDFIIGDDTVIEVKGTSKVLSKHLKGINALCSERTFKNKIIISLEPFARMLKGEILVLPYTEFFRNLWNGKY
jgi:predicted AAA+ superfamily ATPase